MTRAVLIAPLAALWLALTGCGGGSGTSEPTITFTNNDYYEVESTGTTSIPASQGVLSNDVGATVVLAYSSATTAGGTVVVQANGAFTYTPPSPAPSSDTFTFRSEYFSTGSTAVLEGTVRLRVGTFNPTTGGDSFTILEETASGPRSLTATDPNGVAIVSFQVSSPPSQAVSFTFLSDGTYGYTPNTDYSGADQFTYTVTNADGRTSVAGVVSITITDINDAPTVTTLGNQAANDGATVSVAGFATFDVGPPSEDLVQTVLAAPLTCDNLALYSTAPSVSTTTRALNFQTAPSASGVSNCSLTMQDSGGTANGGVDTSPATTFTITVTDVKSPPVVSPPPGPYTFFGNTRLTVPVGSGLLAGFGDPGDSPPDTVHPTEPLRIISAPAGTLTTATDGSFTYDPVAGSRTSDSFTYVVRDNGGLNDTSSVITVTLNFGGMVWWVDNSVAGPGTGTQLDPFNTIALANGATGRLAGDLFRIKQGTGTDTGYDTGFALQDGDKVIGGGVALTAGALTLDAAGGNPLLSEATSGTHAVTLAANNTVSGLTAQATNGGTNYAVFGSAAGSLVTTSLTINSTSGGGIRVAGLASGTNIQVATLNSSGGEHGIRLEGDTSGTGTATFTGLANISASTAAGILLNTDLDASFTATPTSLVVSNSGTGAAGATVTGLGTGQEAGFATTGSITITGGTGLVATDAQVSVAGGGTQALVSSGGPALSLTDVNVGTSNSMTFTTVSATSPTNEGVSLNNVAGTVSLTGVTVQSPQTSAAVAIRLQDSPATVTLNTVTVTSTAQPITALLLTGSTGTATSITGFNFIPTIAGCRGLEVANNHPGFTLTNGTINTSGGAGSGDAIRIAGTAGGTYVIANSTITTAFGAGIVTSGGVGQIEVRPTTSVTCAGGRCVDIDMASTGVGIQVATLSATSGDFGARILNSSNVTLGPAAGSSTLSGQTNNAIFLQNVATATLRNMDIQNGAGSGIVADQVSDLTVDNLNVLDNGNAANEHGLQLSNVTGTTSITDSDFLRSGGSNIDVLQDTSGTSLNLTITNGTYSQASAPVSALDSMHFDVSGGASATVVVTGASFLDQGISKDAIFARVGGTSPSVGNLTLSVGASTFATASSALELSKDEDGDLTATIENSTISGCNNNCIVANSFQITTTGGSLDFSVLNNTLGSAGTAGSASAIADGIRVALGTTPSAGLTATVRVMGNTVQRSNQRGISVFGFVGSGTLASDIVGNTVVSDNFIAMLVGAQTTGWSHCSRIFGNDATPGGLNDAYFLDASLSGTFNIEDTGGGTVAAQIAADNVGTPITESGTPALSATDCVP